ncbi:heparinase II/III family protein [Massilia polaris]|uniref:heparinase II/III family protein n=1 Tax=Massilia polaris TaxID=2728846 RepID=UPI001E308190|nr:alginate lyase family protein [Massilia polaris]
MPPPPATRDPSSGVPGPPVVAGDIKHVWELNRHLHLVRLAQAWRVSGDAAWLEVLRAQVSGWLEQCPPMTGPNWTSSLEMGIRLINWSLVWQLAGGADGPLFAGEGGRDLRRAWLDSIYAHCQSIARHLSRHSSANNHLIGELAGLYVATIAWPCRDPSVRWRDQAARELEREAQAQFSSDGVNREQAFAYHVFSSEFLIVAALAGQASGRPFSSRYWEALERALHFLRSVTDAGGRVPMVGDADDGMVYRLDPENHERAALLLSLGGALAGDRAPQGVTARWLLHAFPGQRPRAIEPAQAAGWAFPDGGYLLFGRDFGAAREIRGLLDCGPLGYLGIAAHGHADALSLTLSVAGEECLVDPGTYSYWQEKEWRDYFRGTSAHNTVRVDGVDQSVSGGRFMWLRKARSHVERMPQSPGQFDFRGAHDGYMRLPDPARHIREVKFDAASATLAVTDKVAARGAHKVEQFGHFAPGLAVTRNDGGVHVRGKAFEMQVEVAGAGAIIELLRGQQDPPLGWYSRSYESKQPCDVVKITTKSNGAPLECQFTISFS